MLYTEREKTFGTQVGFSHKTLSIIGLHICADCIDYHLNRCTQKQLLSELIIFKALGDKFVIIQTNFQYG